MFFCHVGVIRRQSIWNTLIISLGFLLGGINYSILLPRAISLEQIGLIQLQLSIANILAIFACIGIPGALGRFFPYYRNNPSKLRFFFRFLTGVFLSLLTFVSLLYVFFKPIFIKVYSNKSSLYLNHFLGVIPMLLYIAIYHYLDQLASVLYRSVFIVFLRDVLSRILMSLGGVMVLFSFWKFHDFYFYYIFSFFLLIGLSFFSIGANEWKELVFGKSEKIPWNERKQWFIYAFITFLSGTAVVILQNVDKAMLGAFTNLNIVGIYGIYSSLAIVLYLPARAVIRIARVEIYEAWAHQDLFKMNRLYRRLSLILFASCGCIWLLLVVNKEFIFWLLKKPDFISSFPIFFWISVAFLIDNFGGVNALILATSPIYRWDFFLNIFLLISNLILNLILIPKLGGVGAAIASFLSYTLLNLLKTYLLWYYYRLQPFFPNHFYILLLIGIAFGLNTLLPNFESPIVNALFKSSIIGAFFGSSLLLFRLVPDFNDFIIMLYRKFLLRQ